MGKLYRSAMGKPVDMDLLRIANEGAIAVGNMRTNARGDELGPGGKIVRTRNQIIQDYNKMTGKIADDSALPQPQIVETSAPAVKETTKPTTKKVDPRMTDIEDIDGGV